MSVLNIPLTHLPSYMYPFKDYPCLKTMSERNKIEAEEDMIRILLLSNITKAKILWLQETKNHKQSLK